MALVSGALYRIIPEKVPDSCLEIEAGNPDNGTVAQIWETIENNCCYYNQVWIVKQMPGAVPGKPDPYTFCNARSGTYLDLAGGNSDNGTKIQGWAGTPNQNKNRMFWINQHSNGSYHIVNVASNTAIDLKGGDSDNGTDVQGWTTSNNNTNQHWFFKRLSFTAAEIKPTIDIDPILAKASTDFSMDRTYLCLPRALINNIYEALGCPISHLALRSMIAKTLPSL